MDKGTSEFLVPKKMPKRKCEPCGREYSNLSAHKKTKKHKMKSSNCADDVKAEESTSSPPSENKSSNLVVDIKTEDKSPTSPPPENKEKQFYTEYHKFLKNKYLSIIHSSLEKLKEKQRETLIDHQPSFYDFMKNPYDLVARSQCISRFESFYTDGCEKHANIPLEIIDEFYFREAGGKNQYLPQRLNEIVKKALQDRPDKQDICFTFEYICKQVRGKFEKLNSSLGSLDVESTSDFSAELMKLFSSNISAVARKEYGYGSSKQEWFYLKSDLSNENEFVRLVTKQMRLDDLYFKAEEVERKIMSNKTLLEEFSELDLDQQRAAINSLLKPISLVYGEAGTGKSKVLKFIISFVNRMEQTEDDLKKSLAKVRKLKKNEESENEKIISRPTYSFKVVALTGIAAKNMGGQGNACTISKYICNKKQAHGNTLIIEECGMVHLSALTSLLRLRFREMEAKGRIIFCGDARQLPPVSGCHLLDAMIRSKLFNAVELKTQWRSDNVITKNAQMIYSGTTPQEIINRWKLSPKDKFHLFLDNDENVLAKEMIEQIQLLYGKDISSSKSTGDALLTARTNNLETQLLSPNSSKFYSRQGNEPLRERKTSVPILNRNFDLHFREKFSTVRKNFEKSVHPSLVGKSNLFSIGIGAPFFEGQRVTVKSNIYDDNGTAENNDNYGELLVAKGESGTVFDILAPTEKKYNYRVNFKESKNQILDDDQLESGYTLTVHKCQGLGFENVLFIASDSMGPDSFKTKQLLYTAITRTKEKFILCTTEKCLKKMLSTENNYGKSHVLEKLIGYF